MRNASEVLVLHRIWSVHVLVDHIFSADELLNSSNYSRPDSSQSIKLLDLHETYITSKLPACTGTQELLQKWARLRIVETAGPSRDRELDEMRSR